MMLTNWNWNLRMNSLWPNQYPPNIVPMNRARSLPRKMFTVFIMFNKAQLFNKTQASIDFDKCASLYRDEACITQESKLCHFCFLFSSLSNVRVSRARAKSVPSSVRYWWMAVYGGVRLGARRNKRGQCHHRRRPDWPWHFFLHKMWTSQNITCVFAIHDILQGDVSSRVAHNDFTDVVLLYWEQFTTHKLAYTPS